MVFLTYHRITRSPEQDIFSLSGDQLRSHIRMLAEKRFVQIGVDHLLVEGGASSFAVSFDDGTLDHFELVTPLLEECGLRGIFFVPTGKIGGKGRLTRSHIAEMHQRGHEIGCHSHEHRRLDTLSDTAIDEQLARSCGILGEITGHRPIILAPPGGYTNGKVRAACARAGMKALRTMKWGLNEKPNILDLETIALYRDFPMARFEKILNGQGLRGLRALYFGKQMLKALLPISLYERARNLVFRK